MYAKVCIIVNTNAWGDCLGGVIRFCFRGHWWFVTMLPLSQCLLFRLCCILPSVFQVKCSMLLWAIRWLLRRPVWSVRGGNLSWRPLASFMLPGGRVWTNVTMAGSLMVVHDIQFQYPECSVGEAWSVSGPCTATETRLASRNQLRSLELTVLKVNLHTSCCC